MLPKAVVFAHANVVLFSIAVEARGMFRFGAVNDAFLAATGLKRSQVEGKRVAEVIPAASGDLVLKKYRQAVRTGKPVTWAESTQYPTGMKHGEVSATPVRDAAGRIKHLACMVHDVTARKEAEAALAASRERYARALRGTHDGLWDWIITTGEEYHSPQWNKLLGYRDGELPNHKDTFYSLVHPDDVARVRAAVRAHLTKRVRYSVELRMRAKDGTWRWIRTRGEAERDAKGKPIRMAGAITDITARKEVEAALRESEERYRLLADHTDNIVSLSDIHGNNLYISPSFFRKAGWTLDDLKRRSWRTRVHPADIPMVERARNANLAGKATEIEYRLLCRDGSVLWMESNCKPIRDKAGKVWRMLVRSHDFTARKQAEEQTKREQAFNQALVNHASLMIVVLDAKARILHVNQAAADGLGRRPEEILGRTPWAIGLMDEQETGRSKKRFRGLVHGATPATVEVRLRTKGGEWRTVELRSTTTRLPDGTIDRVIVTATDLTERLRLQQEVLRISEQEHARIGHDLHDGVGQTMTGVASLLDALEQELEGEAKQSAGRIRQLLQEAIQDVRRMSHGLSPAAVRHRELGGALKLLAETIRTNFRTDCLCQIASDICLADPDRQMHLFRIAQEAVNNALRHSKPTRIKLTLQRHGRELCEMKIENNGSGMPKRSKDGGGIGLQVMDYRANLIGGVLKVQNGRRNGVVVSCRFPCQA